MDELINYIFEAGMLKRVSRSGWWTEGVKNPESVGDHTFRVALIAFVLAKMEGETDEVANKVCTASVFHDMLETRLLDLNKITARYVEVTKNLERTIELEQVKGLPEPVKGAILKNFDLSDKEYRIVKDADYLECAFQAKEYSDIGYSTSSWVIDITKKLQTESARKLAEKLVASNSKAWLKGLKKL